MNQTAQGNNLFKNIPGLAAHQVKAPVRVVPFNREKADRLMSEALVDVGVYIDSDGYTWLKENRPDVHKFLRECCNELEASVLAADWKRFMSALEKWRAGYKRAGSVYDSRPPVIEVDQEELF